jgi:hypothetical protein
MQTFLGLFMMIANVVAGVLVFFSIDRNWDNRRKIISLAVVFGGMYLIVSILYLLSSIGLNAAKLPSGARNLLVSAFVAVNIIIFIPFIIRSYNKMENKELGQRKFENRLKLAGVIFLIVLLMEFFSIRGTIKNIFEQYNALVEKEKTEKSNVITNEINNEEIKNEERNTTENKSVTTEQRMNTTIVDEEEEIRNVKDDLMETEPIYTEVIR